MSACLSLSGSCFCFVLRALLAHFDNICFSHCPFHPLAEQGSGLAGDTSGGYEVQVFPQQMRGANLNPDGNPMVRVGEGATMVQWCVVCRSFRMCVVDNAISAANSCCTPRLTPSEVSACLPSVCLVISMTCDMTCAMTCYTPTCTFHTCSHASSLPKWAFVTMVRIAPICIIRSVARAPCARIVSMSLCLWHRICSAPPVC